MSESESDARRSPDRVGFARRILDDQEAFELFMIAIDERVERRRRETSERNRVWFVGLFAAIATIAVGAATFGTYIFDVVTENMAFESRDLAIKAIEEEKDSVVSSIEKIAATTQIMIKEGVEREVKENVQKVLETTFASIQFDSQLAALNFRLLSIEFADDLNKEILEAIMTEIQTLYTSSQADPEALDKLVFAVDRATSLSVDMEEFELILQLEDAVPDLMARSGDASVWLTHLLGNRLLADAGAPDSWKDVDSLTMKTYERYWTYAERARDNGYPEHYLLYKMLLNFVGKEPAGQINGLIEEAGDLNDLDADNFVRTMKVLQKGGVGLTEAQKDTLASRIKNFLCLHEDASPLLGSVSKEVALQCP